MAGLTTSAAGEQVSGARRMFNKAVLVLERSCSERGMTQEDTQRGAPGLFARSCSRGRKVGGINEWTLGGR